MNTLLLIRGWSGSAVLLNTNELVEDLGVGFPLAQHNTDRTLFTEEQVYITLLCSKTSL